MYTYMTVQHHLYTTSNTIFFVVFFLGFAFNFIIYNCTPILLVSVLKTSVTDAATKYAEGQANIIR